jgi:hypothetical protein
MHSKLRETSYWPDNLHLVKGQELEVSHCNSPDLVERKLLLIISYKIHFRYHELSLIVSRELK